MYTSLAQQQMDDLVELLHEIGPPHPCAVGVASTDDDVELAWMPLLDPDPTESLVGVRAPEHWSAFAVCSPGQAGLQAPPGPKPTPVRVVHLVTRDGREASDVRPVTDDGRLPAITEPGTGWVADVCRRVLSLPTPPPATTTAELLAVLWLDAILTMIIEGDLDDPPPDWHRCRSQLGPLAATGPLSTLGAEVARECPWPIVRRLATRSPMVGLSRQAAAWLDDGSFARLVLGSFAPVDEMRRDAAELLTPATAAELEGVLRRWLPGGGL